MRATEFKFRAYNNIVKRFQYFTLEDIGNMKDAIQWHILDITQSTNKKDVDGNEIYVGDIVIFDDNSLDISHKKWHPSFEVLNNLGLKDVETMEIDFDTLHYYSNKLKIISNIYQNKQ